MENAAIATEPKHFPGFWISIAWVALYFLFQIIGGAIAFGIALVLGGHENASAAQIAALRQDLELIALPTVWSLACAGVLTLFLLWLYLRRDERAAAIQLDRWSSLSPAVTIALSVTLVGAGLLFNYAYSAFVFPDVEMQDQVRRMFAAIPKTPGNWVLLFATVAIIAPLLEELLFRGLLQNSLSHRMPIWAAIAISSAIFAAIHMQLYAFPALMALGAVFGYIYHKTGSLRVTIALHMINNAAALALG
jgi:membrane protease YdiL (CAAX protease family)